MYSSKPCFFLQLMLSLKESSTAYVSTNISFIFMALQCFILWPHLYVSIFLQTDMWVVSSYLSLQTLLLWTFLHMSASHRLRGSLGQSLHLGRELLSHTVCANRNLLMPYCDPKCLSQCLLPPTRVSVIPQAKRI